MVDPDSLKTAVRVVVEALVRIEGVGYGFDDGIAYDTDLPPEVESIVEEEFKFAIPAFANGRVIQLGRMRLNEVASMRKTQELARVIFFSYENHATGPSVRGNEVKELSLRVVKNRNGNTYSIVSAVEDLG